MLAFVHVALWETAIIDRILIIRICPILCTFHLHIILFPKPGAIDATCRISAAAAAARPLLSDSRLTCNMFPSATVCPSGTQSCDFSCDSFASNQKVNFSQGFCRAASRMCVCVCLCILLLASCTHRENNHKTPPPSPPSPLQQKQQSICAFVLVFACSAISVCASFILFVCAIIFRHSLGFLLLLLLLMGYWTIDSTEFIVRPGTGDHFSVRDFCSDKCWKVHCADIYRINTHLWQASSFGSQICVIGFTCFGLPQLFAALHTIGLFKAFSHIFHSQLPTTKSTIARQVVPAAAHCLAKRREYSLGQVYSTGANYFDKWPKNCLALFKTCCMHSRKKITYI